MTRFLYDTAVFVYAFGGEHSYKVPCKEIVRLAGTRRLRGEASADLLQELAHQRTRRTGDRENARYVARRVRSLCQFHSLEVEDVERGIALFEIHPRLDARDSVFAAVALNRGIDTILSPDRGFDEVGGLRRIDPADDAGVNSLLVDPPGDR